MRHVSIGASRGAPLWYSQMPAGDVTCELYCSFVTQVWSDTSHVRKGQWSDEREQMFLSLYKKLQPGKIGYLERLTALWNKKLPELQTTSTALCQRISVIRKRKTIAEQLSDGNQDDWEKGEEF